MIYSALNASIKRTARQRFSESSLSGFKGKRTYSLNGGLLRAFLDTFDRVDNALSLAGSTGGPSKWQTIRGTWGISGNKANSTTAASSYPLAGINTGTKSVKIKVSNPNAGACGYGLAFWVSDGSNWYGAHTDRTYVQTSFQYDYSYPCSYQYQGCCGGAPYVNCGDNGGNPCCGYPKWTGDSGHACAACGCGGCSTYFSGPVGTGCPNGGTLASSNYNGNGQDECAVCGGCQGYSTCTWSGTCTGTATGYTDNYTYYAYLVRMSGGTVSTLQSLNLGTTTTGTSNIPFIQIETNTTSPNSVRLTAQRDSNAPQTVVVALTSPTQTNTHGVLIGPRTSGTNAATQSTNIDDFDYTPLQ